MRQDMDLIPGERETGARPKVSGRHAPSYHLQESASSDDSSVLVVSEDLPSPFRTDSKDRAVVGVLHEGQDDQLVPRCGATGTPKADPSEGGPRSLGQQMMAMATEARQVEKRYQAAMTENKQLQSKLQIQSSQIEHLSETVKYLGAEMKSRFQQVYPNRNTEIRKDERSPKNEPANPRSKQEEGGVRNNSYGRSGNEDSVVNLRPQGNVHLHVPAKNVGNLDDDCENQILVFGNTCNDNSKSSACSNCARLVLKEEQRRMETERQLSVERQKVETLKARLESLSRQLTEMQQPSQIRSVDGFSSHDQVVQDLLTEISVLQQQMVVVVEDFEKERTDRARAVSSRNKLKDNFESLNEKVRSLKSQLMMAHGRLTDFVAKNNSLERTVQQLQTELRSKDEKIAQLVLSARNNAYDDRIHVPPMYVASNQPVPSHFMPNSTFPLNSRPSWSCNSCTYRNSGRRTVCEICGNINPQNSSSRSAEFLEHGRPLERSCRLVSRGLSTDEELTELTHQDRTLNLRLTADSRSL